MGKSYYIILVVIFVMIGAVVVAQDDPENPTPIRPPGLYFHPQFPGGESLAPEYVIGADGACSNAILWFETSVPLASGASKTSTFIVSDATGKVLAQWTWRAVGAIGGLVTTFENFTIGDLTARPLTVKLFDIAPSGELFPIYNAEFDPADVITDCLNYGYIDLNPGQITDGRVGSTNTMAAVYVNNKGIHIRDILGNIRLNVPLEMIIDTPPNEDENLLLASSDDGYYTIYVLTTGEYQVNVGPDANGIVEAIIFNTSGLRTGGYTFNINDIINAQPPTPTPDPTFIRRPEDYQK